MLIQYSCAVSTLLDFVIDNATQSGVCFLLWVH